MPNRRRLFSRSAFNYLLAGLSLSVSLVAVSQPQARAQSFDTGPVGGVSFGANGPQGFISAPASQPVMNIPTGGGPGFSIVGGDQAERSLGATGAQTHDSQITGPGAWRADGDYSSNRTSRSNPVRGMGSNFGLRKTETGLLAPSSFDGAPLPQNNRHFTYGFDNGGGGYYQSMYGGDRAVNNFIDGLLPGIISTGRPRLPPVSHGSVDIDIAPNSGH